MHSWKSWKISLLLLSLVGGCTVGPNYHTPRTPLPAKFSATTQPATTQASTRPAPTEVNLTRWWQTFNDPALNRLIDEAVDRNLDVRLANARIREARAQLEFNRAALFPTADSSASYSRSLFSKNAFAPIATSNGQTSGGTTGTGTGGTTGSGGTTGTGNSTGSTGSTNTPFSLGRTNLYRAGFDAGWEIDVFGGTRRAIEAAQSSLQAQVEARRNILVTLLSEVAQNYIILRGLQHEEQVVRNNLEAQRSTLNLQQVKLQAGLTNNLTIAQAKALAASTESELPTLDTQIQQTIQRLAVLLDRDPTSIESELKGPADIPVGPPSIPPGLPSDLVRRRPDVRQAERQLAAATANIGVAKADLFPKFSLTGSLGLESLQLKTLAKSASAFWSFGPTVSWRIFDAGQIWANVHVQNARQEEALIQYRQAIIQSLADVENALTAYNREQARNSSLRGAVEANRQAVALSKQLNEAGVVDFLNVLTAQQSLYQSEDQLAQSDQKVSTDLIALYKALGGGWETTEQAVSAR